MGPDDDDIVDDRLRVRGIDGLRVADLSIMPIMLSGNTNAPAMAMAARAADLILDTPARAGSHRGHRPTIDSSRPSNLTPSTSWSPALNGARSVATM